jgi:hypothetical protein
MKKSRFTETQIVGMLKEYEGGKSPLTGASVTLVPLKVYIIYDSSINPLFL